MIQYCRYCQNAEDYNGEGTDFFCFADARCGEFGHGKFYSRNKAVKVNHCKYFEFNSYDIFRVDEDGHHKEYKPRQKCEKEVEGQITLF